MDGTVKKIVLDRGFGFIAKAAGGGDVFFHARDLSDDLPFDEQLIERRVTFDVRQTEKGPRAGDVRPMDR